MRRVDLSRVEGNGEEWMRAVRYKRLNRKTYMRMSRVELSGVEWSREETCDRNRFNRNSNRMSWLEMTGLR